MERYIPIAAVIGWAGWLLTGSLLPAGIALAVLLFGLTFAPIPRRTARIQKRWSYGGGLVIPPFFAGFRRQGDDQ